MVVQDFSGITGKIPQKLISLKPKYSKNQISRDNTLNYPQ